MAVSNNITVGPNTDDSPGAVQRESGADANPILENPLKKFSSQSCVLTLGVLSKAEIADPDNTYRIDGPRNVILKSGGVGDSKPDISYEQSLGITTEYFIEDLEIQAVMGFTPSTRQTNATLFSFQVIEPYSMGLFLETLAVAALNAGGDEVSSYLDAAYLLMLEFTGYDDSGNQITVPNTKRFFPLKLSRVNFNVTAGGSVYDVSAYAWSEQALADEVQTIYQDSDLVGETVADLLQIGGENNESLTSIINKYHLEQKDEGNAKSADAYVIMFPEDTASKNDPFKNSVETTEGATTQSGVTNLSSGVEENGISLDTIQDFAEETINEIGRSRVDSSTFTSGNSKFGRQDIQIEDGIAFRGDIEFNETKNERYINIPKGYRIQEVIENIIIYSDYGRKLATALPDERGMLKWFRIETETYNIVDPENVQQRGRSARIFVYRVVPYLIHASHFVGPSQKSPGIEELRKKIPKRYDYIYSGKNDDIIDFDITFNTAFYNAIQMDLSQFSQDAIANGAFSSGPDDDRTTPGLNQGEEDRGPIANEPSGQTLFSGQANTSSAPIAGGATETPETAISRQFNDVIVNGVDLITAEMEILGDPYYLGDSGTGNYRAERLGNQTTSDSTIDYQYEEAHLLLNFKTPIDINSSTGTMDFPDVSGEPVRKFSGIYRVLTLTNTISGNKFTQRLTMVRLRNQIGEDTDSNSLILFDGDPLFNSFPLIFEPDNSNNNGTEGLA